MISRDLIEQIMTECQDSNFRDVFRELESQVIRMAIERTGTNTKAAAALGMLRSTMLMKMKARGLPLGEYSNGILRGRKKEN